MTPKTYVTVVIYNCDLFNDGEENRNLDVILYSPFLQDYSSGIILFHILTPFSINLFSTIIIIGKATRRRTLTLTEQHYKQHLRDQLDRHKQLLISPIVLILLSIPRLVISFVSGCIKTLCNP